MILVDSVFVDPAVVTAQFCCDLKACAGACCCLEGGRGAPLEDAEVPFLRESYAAVKDYLPARNREVLEQIGPVEGESGNYATVCVDHKECVFVYFDQGIAKCSVERAFEEGRITWRKPISCHLFPVRVRHSGQQVIRYEQISECRSGRTNGANRGVHLLDFLKEALIRRFGERWYTELKRQGDRTTGPL